MSENKVIQRGQQCYVEIQGALTAAVVPTLQSDIRKMLELKMNEVSFDLKNCTMLDSSGIGLMMATFNTLAAKSGKISVVNVNKDIAKLLASMRLTARLGVQQDA